MDPKDLSINSIPPKNDGRSINSPKNKEDLQKIKKACKDFEAILAYQLLKTMRQTVPKSSFMGNSAGRETYNMLMDQKVAEDLANRGSGLGIQKMLFEQLTKNYSKQIAGER